MSTNDELTYEDLQEELGDIFGQDQVAVLEAEPEREDYIHPFEFTAEFLRNVIPGLDVNDRGLFLPEGATLAQAQSLADFFESNLASMPLLWGDLLNQAEERWRGEWSQIVSDRIGKSEGTIRNWRYVCNQIPRDMRPDPTEVRISKLYHIAGMKTPAMKETLIEMVRVEGLDTKTTQAVCDLVKTWPDEERPTMEDYYVGLLERTNMDHQEFMAEVRADLIREGVIEDPDAQEEDMTALEKAEKTGEETAQDLVDKLLKLAEAAEANVPQNVLALFASSIQLAKVIAFSGDAQTVKDSFYTLGVVADHLAELRLAQIEQGRLDVGCICELEDLGGLSQFADCPVHGHSSEIDEEDGGDAE